MAPRTLIVLALLVAALAGFIWFVERDLPSTDERRQEAARILPVDDGEVRALVIERDGQSARLELRTDGELPEDEASLAGEWWLVEPLAGRANDDEVTSAIAGLLALEHNRLLDDVSWNDVGLAEPRLLVSVETEEQAWEMVVGAEIPASDEVIVAVGGERVYVVPGAFVDSLMRQPGEWRERRLFPVTEREIETVAVNGDGVDLRLDRGAGGFDLSRPVEDEADADQTQELLRELVGLEVVEFVDGVDSSSIVDAESLPVQFEVTTSSSEEPFVVLMSAVGTEGEPRRAVAGGQVVTVDTGLLEIVSRPPVEWRSREWTRLAAFEVDRVTIVRDGKSAEIVREGGDWVGAEGIYPYAAVRDFLDVMTAVEGDWLREDVPADELEKLLTIELSSASGTEVLELFREGNNARAGKVGRAAGLELASSTATEIVDATEQLLAAVAADEAADPA